MALPLVDAMLTTPKISTLSSGKTCRRRSAPLPPAAPRNCRQILSAGQQSKCSAHLIFKKLKGKIKNKDDTTSSDDNAVKYPTITLAVQQRRHSAPAFAAFSEAFSRMKQNGSKIGGGTREERRGRSTTSKKEKVTNATSNSASTTTSTAAAMDRLNALFPTSPGSLRKAARRRQQLEQQQQQMPSLSFGNYKKNTQFSASSSTGKLSALGGFPKVGSSGRLSAFPRTPSGGRIVSGAMRRVRSGNNLY